MVRIFGETCHDLRLKSVSENLKKESKIEMTTLKREIQDRIFEKLKLQSKNKLTRLGT